MLFIQNMGFSWADATYIYTQPNETKHNNRIRKRERRTELESSDNNVTVMRKRKRREIERSMCWLA